MQPRRRALLLAVAAVAIHPLGMAAAPTARKPSVEVWKDPQCGCCADWVAHLQANGFAVTVHETGNTAARARLGIANRYGSCHTAQVGGYAIEGHVPARDIHRLLAEKPAALGLAVPGMPVGSPGMDAPAYGGRRDAYDVLLLASDGSAQVWSHYRGNKA
ncbi:DUF411 domain-containing protein [Ramlibacter sp. AW1]|uniref:DUF411 domain-containing protein n=2 Tax=Ramlibacter aurantiacus TaxID=2801330 RepID=A0A937D422_9BURK|nr:DUF411 domain-containing protein [Ramlibacter aurantiacus]